MSGGEGLTPFQPGSDQRGGMFMDLAGGDGKGASPSAAPGFGGSRGPSFSNPVAVVALIAALAGGAIVGMRYLGSMKMVAFDLGKVEYTPGEADPAAEQRFVAIMDALDGSSRPVQVPIARVNADPFSYRSSVFFGPLLDDEAPVLATGNDTDRAALLAAERLRREQEERNKQIDAAIAKIQMQGLIGGRRPVARINGLTLRVGDAVDDIFTVVEVDRRGAVVEANGRRFLLQLNEEPIELDD